MATNLSIDSKLLDAALKAGGLKQKKIQSTWHWRSL